MTVRWKPLLILSGLFVVVALVGVIAITMTLVPRSSQGFLKLARESREAGRFEDAEIRYKQALQIDGKNAAIHEEFAGLYQDWARAPRRETGDPACRMERPVAGGDQGQDVERRGGSNSSRMRWPRISSPTRCTGRASS